MPPSTPASRETEQKIDLWFGVLMRLADGFPASKFALVGTAELREMAGTWADELASVPAMAIPELHRRTMSKHVSTFAPSIGDYRASWLDPAWDFWAQYNADEEKNAPALPMLPEGPRDTDGPGFTAAQLQFARLARGKEMVACECYDANGFALTATLSPNKTFWVCALCECSFSLEIERSDEAPSRPRRDTQPAKSPQEKDAETKTTGKGRATLADIRRAAEACDVELEGMEPKDHANFCGWVNWFKRTSPGTPMSYTVLELTWTQYQEYLQERSRP